MVNRSCVELGEVVFGSAVLPLFRVCVTLSVWVLLFFGEPVQRRIDRLSAAPPHRCPPTPCLLLAQRVLDPLKRRRLVPRPGCPSLSHKGGTATTSKPAPAKCTCPRRGACLCLGTVLPHVRVWRRICVFVSVVLDRSTSFLLLSGHLHMLTGSPTTVHVIDMSVVPDAEDLDVLPALTQVTAPRLRRQGASA